MKEIQCKQSYNKGPRNGIWKGDKVQVSALHAWVKRNLVKPQTCRDCNQPKALDLANISQEYKRDLSDWEWLCRSCHMKKDGRTKKLIENAANKLRGTTWSEERKAKKRGRKHTEETIYKLKEKIIGRKRDIMGRFI